MRKYNKNILANDTLVIETKQATLAYLNRVLSSVKDFLKFFFPHSDLPFP